MSIFFERQSLAKLGCSTPIYGTIAAVIAYVFWGWKVFWIVVIGTVALTVLFFTVLENLINKMWLKKGVDVKNLKWCKTCQNFKKIKDWEDKLHYLEERVNDDQLPCKIVSQSKDVWEKYFSTPRRDKTLYPKNYCSLWIKK